MIPRSLKEPFVRKYLEPGESLGEILFGLIMVLTFTLGAGLTADEGAEGARQLLIAALGCNLAWGIIDGVMYVMNSMFDRSRKARLLRELQRSSDDSAAFAFLGRELDPKLEPISTAEERRHIYEKILTLVSRAQPGRTRVERSDLGGALASCLLVFATSLPAALPFLFIREPRLALRVSNALLIGMLFLVGYSWARHTNSNRLGMGLALMLVGVVLVAVAIALGG